jgi:hypothetical protein
MQYYTIIGYYRVPSSENAVEAEISLALLEEIIFNITYSYCGKPSFLNN